MISRKLLLALILTAGLFAPAPAEDAPARPKPAAKREPPVITDAAALPVAITANDPSIHYGGRWDTSKGDPRCQWSGCTVVLKFNGTDLNAKLEDANGQNVWQAEVDGKPTMKIPLGKETHTYSIAAGLPPGEHTVRLVKATESRGITTVHGFELGAGGALVAAPAPAHYLEVIGDSITCGNGNEGSKTEMQDTSDWENAYYSYGDVAARKFGADYSCVAWSGGGLTNSQALPPLYDDIFLGDKSVKWDFSKFPADAVLINLSTNDFGRPGMDEATWTTAYKDFIARIRGHYPTAMIYCATSPMMGGEKLELSKKYLNEVVSALNSAGDSKVALLEFEGMRYPDGTNASGHPNVATHQIMADKLSDRLAKDLGWVPVETK